MKITVKQYLNDKVKLKITSSYMENGEKVVKKWEKYPVYNQITFNRRTTQIKSFTETYFSKEEYRDYLSGNYCNEDDLNDFIPLLDKEPLNIKLAIEYLLKVKEDFRKEGYWIEKMKFLLDAVDFNLAKIFWEYIFKEEHKNNESFNFYLAFDKEEFLLCDSLCKIKEFTGIDLTPFVKSDYLEWNYNIKKISDAISDLETETVWFTFPEIIKDNFTFLRNIEGLKNKELFIKRFEETLDNYLSEDAHFYNRGLI